jgi:hypothetical protein
MTIRIKIVGIFCCIFNAGDGRQYRFASQVYNMGKASLKHRLVREIPADN